MNNWIKVNASLRTNPKLVTLASQIGVTHVTALGAICHVWMIADEHADENGLIKFMSSEALDGLIGIEGLSKALESVGWLEDLGDSLIMPDYAQHNGSTGKTRAEAQKRKAKSRANVTHVTGKRDTPVTEVGPEKIERRERRERDNISKPILRVLTPIQQDLHSHFKRRQSTAWSDKERKAYRSATAGKTAEEFAEEVSLVLADQSKSEYPVKSLETLLNNWSRKIDEASMVPTKPEQKPQKYQILP